MPGAGQGARGGFLVLNWLILVRGGEGVPASRRASESPPPPVSDALRLTKVLQRFTVPGFQHPQITIAQHQKVKAVIYEYVSSVACHDA